MPFTHLIVAWLAVLTVAVVILFFPQSQPVVLQGDRGPAGIPGPRGPQGMVGERGERGEQGVQGMIGDRGWPGRPGPQGERGLQGPPGPQGPAGETVIVHDKKPPAPRPSHQKRKQRKPAHPNVCEHG